MFISGFFSDLHRAGVRFDDQDNAGLSNGDGDGDSNKYDKDAKGNKDDKNNLDPNVDQFAKLWENDDSETAEEKTARLAAEADAAKNKKTPQEVYDEFIGSQNLTENIDLSKIAEEIRNGETGALETAFKQIATNSFSRAVMASNTLTTQKIEAAVEKAVKQSKGAADTDFAVRQMDAQLKFTSAPSIAPVAKDALNRLMKQGKSIDDAIIGVKEFFHATAQNFAKETGLALAPRSRPGTNRFAETNNDDEEGTQATDFMKLLGGDEFIDKV